MKTEELVALLREARNELDVLASYVGHPDTVWPNVGLKTTAQCHKIMRDRIDAALAEGCPDCGHPYGQQEYCQGDGHAERVDSATPVVEWVHREGSRIWSGGLGNAMFDVVLHDDGWRWVVVRERESGVCNTFDEAQRAALAAARGMR